MRLAVLKKKAATDNLLMDGEAYSQIIDGFQFNYFKAFQSIIEHSSLTEIEVSE